MSRKLFPFKSSISSHCLSEFSAFVIRSSSTSARKRPQFFPNSNLSPDATSRSCNLIPDSICTPSIISSLVNPFAEAYVFLVMVSSLRSIPDKGQIPLRDSDRRPRHNSFYARCRCSVVAQSLREERRHQIRESNQLRLGACCC